MRHKLFAFQASENEINFTSFIPENFGKSNGSDMNLEPMIFEVCKILNNYTQYKTNEDMIAIYLDNQKLETDIDSGINNMLDENEKRRLNELVTFISNALILSGM